MANLDKSVFLLFFLSFLCYHSFSQSDDEIKKICNYILDDLYEANAIKKIKKPSLQISSDNQYAAEYRPFSNAIFIDRKLYDICQAFGQDANSALAFVIGHELAHAYQNEHRRMLYLKGGGEDGDTHKEKEADIQGLFNAYLAGFQSHKILPELIESIYRAYHLLDEPLPGYPPFEERKKTAHEVQKRVNELILLFESANYLTVIGKYKYAASCYNEILDSYKSREIHNNLGVVYALEAMTFKNDPSDAFWYPFELDAQTRLKKEPFRGTHPDRIPSIRKLFLKDAQFHFDEAIKLDNSYLTASINRMCIDILLGKPQAAIDYYNMLLSFYGDKNNHIEMVLALAYANTEGFQKEGEKRLKNLARENVSPIVSAQAKYNLDIIKDKKYKSNWFPVSFECMDPIKKYGAIEGKYVGDYLGNRGKLIDTSEEWKLYFFYEKINHSTIVNLRSSDDKAVAIHHVPVNNGPIVNRDSLRNIQTKVVSTSTGNYLLCEQEKKVFLLDKDNRVVQWIKYFVDDR